MNKNWLLGIVATVIALAIISFSTYSVSTVYSNDKGQSLLKQIQDFQKIEIDKNTVDIKECKKDTNELKTVFARIDERLNTLQKLLEEIKNEK